MTHLAYTGTTLHYIGSLPVSSNQFTSGELPNRKKIAGEFLIRMINVLEELFQVIDTFMSF